MADEVLVRTVPGFEEVVIVQLNRPGQSNSVNDIVMEQLETILDDLNDKIQIIILTAAGDKVFCAGGDLRYFSTLKTRSDGEAMSLRMQAILRRLWEGDRVVIGAVNGKALGGGCEILTACHFRIVSEDGTFQFVQAKNGLTTGWGGGVRLLRLLGRTQALRLLITGECIDACEAKRIGFVDRVVSGDSLESAALEMAREISNNSPSAVRAFLKLVSCDDRFEVERLTNLETEFFADSWESNDFREALSVFLRRPS